MINTQNRPNSTLDLPKMKNARISILEILIVRHHAEEQLRVLRQRCGRRQQPAITQLSLLHVEPRITLDEELRIVGDFHWPQPLDRAAWTTRELQRRVDGREVGILEQFAVGQTLLANGVEVLDGSAAGTITALVAELFDTEIK